MELVKYILKIDFNHYLVTISEIMKLNHCTVFRYFENVNYDLLAYQKNKVKSDISEILNNYYKFCYLVENARNVTNLI
jgi:hypothetical protein